MPVPYALLLCASAERGQSVLRRYCGVREAQLEKRRGALLAEEQARCGCGQEAQRVSALRQFLVGPVLHQVA